VKYLIKSFFKELSIVLLSGIAGLSLLFTLGGEADFVSSGKNRQHRLYG
jgi:hypothetical protein